MELSEVCESLLDNADMSIDFSAYPRIILLSVVQGTVNGKYWKVVFECGQVVHLDAVFDDDSSNTDLFVVLEASVKETQKSKLAPAIQHRIDRLNDRDPVWEVYLYGSMSLKVVTTKFNWMLTELTKKEHEAMYA